MLKDLLDGKQHPTVLVIGDLMLDEHVFCSVTGLSPEDDLAPKLRILNRKHSPGGAANVAMNLVGLGAEVVLVGRVGQDDEAVRLTRMLNQPGLELMVTAVPDTRTTHKTRFITTHGRHVARIDSEDTMPTPAPFEERLQNQMRGLTPDVVVVSDYAKGMVTPSFMNFVRFLKAPVLVDPKRSDLCWYGSVHALTPNEKEFMTAVQGSNKSVPAYLEWLFGKEHHRPENVIVTGAGDGCMHHCAESSKRWLVRKQSVVDPAGCGDSFLAGLAFGVGCKMELGPACGLANACGSCAVSRVGVHVVTRQEVLAELEQFNYEEVRKT